MIRKILRLIALGLLPAVAFGQTQMDRIKSRGQSTFDSVANTQTIQITGATPSVSGGNVFETNNSSATTITNFLNGSDSQKITVICGDANTIIASNSNIYTPSLGNLSCFLDAAYEFVYVAPFSRWVQIGSASSGGSSLPAGPGLAMQFANFGVTATATASTSLGTAGVDSTSVPTVLNLPFSLSVAGPNPSIDVQAYGARPTNGQVSTTCTTVGGTANVSCASLANFKPGDGVTIQAAGNAPTITTPAAPTVTSPFVTGTGTLNYQCLPLDAADGFPAASPIASVTNVPAVFGNAPVTNSNVVWTGGTATVTTSSTFDANYASYSANTKSVSVTGMGSGLTALNNYWVIASEPSATSYTFAVAGSGSGTFTGSQSRATNTVPGVSATRTGSALAVTMAYALPINVNSYLAPTVFILAGWQPADINGRYAISSNLGDTVSGAVITVHNTPMNETESSTQAGTVTVYEGIQVACPNITAGTVQYEVYGNSNPGGAMAPIGKTPYGQRTFMDYGYWMRNGSSGFYVPPYIPTSPPVAAQNDMYVGKIISIAGNNMTVSPNVPSTVTSATTFHDDTTAILAAAAVISGGGAVVLTPPDSAACAGCGYHTKFPLILPSKVDLELEAPLDADETIVGSSATNAANGIWKGPNAVGQTTCGQFGQKKCEPLYGHANPIVALPGGQNNLTGLVLSTNQNGTSNSDDGQILAQFGAGRGAQGSESMSDDYLTTNDATTSTPLLAIGQISPFQIRDSNFSASWPNSLGQPGQINLLPNLGAIWARAGDNSTDNGIMPGAFTFSGIDYFSGKGFLLDSQNWTTGGISSYNFTALNDDQQPVTPFFMDYGGDLPAENVNIANVTMDSNTVSLVAQMTSGNGGGNWWFANNTTSGGAPAVTGQVIPALTVRDVTPLLGQNYNIVLQTPVGGGEYTSLLTTPEVNIVSGVSGFDAKLTFGGSTANRNISLPDGAGTISLHSLYSCGTLAACSPSLITGGWDFSGEAALVSGSPSTVTITGFSPAFTSTSTFDCQAIDMTAPNAISVTKVSSSSVTFSETPSNTDVISFRCSGY